MSFCEFTDEEKEKLDQLARRFDSGFCALCTAAFAHDEDVTFLRVKLYENETAAPLWLHVCLCALCGAAVTVLQQTRQKGESHVH